VPCGQCEWCRRDMANNCAVNLAIGYQFPGCMAEYLLLSPLVVEGGPICPIPDHVADDEAALAEPLACCLNGLEISGVSPGDVVCILGAGPIGCLLTWAAQSMGAGKVILIQRSRGRLEVAAAAGPDRLICSENEDPVAAVIAETGGRGADLVITAAPTAEAQSQALEMVRIRGRVNLFAGLPRDLGPVPLDSNIIHYRECSVQGAHGASPRHHRAALALIARGAIPVRRLITHHFPLREVREAVDTAESHRGMKVIIQP
jgi:L-iditol 2-dehydrogenase